MYTKRAREQVKKSNTHNKFTISSVSNTLEMLCHSLVITASVADISSAKLVYLGLHLGREFFSFKVQSFTFESDSSSECVVLECLTSFDRV